MPKAVMSDPSTRAIASGRSTWIRRMTAATTGSIPSASTVAMATAVTVRGRLRTPPSTAMTVANVATAVARVLRRRGIAVLVVMLLGISAVAVTGYLTVDGLVHQTRTLQRVAPARAAAIEREGRFAEAARSFALKDKVERAVKDLPDRL